MKMYRIQNDTHVVFFPSNNIAWAYNFRRAYPEFKRRRIVGVLQMHPSEVIYGNIYNRT